MRSFTTSDLNKQVGEITEAARKGPVIITHHRKPKFVLMSMEHYDRLRGAEDPRRAYSVGETPAEIASQFADELDRLAHGEGYDDEA
ncbi:MAG: type II toxin-antitoxin system prevent-host-death family antitoxin [Inquilinus sp.]|uniref:type II toxin-antitoxin system prevent-host-death family antitoxin n=1 Tax=Inquilinus sp. TaxID=1932117 RepID=UPI003F3238D4